MEHESPELTLVQEAKVRAAELDSERTTLYYPSDDTLKQAITHAMADIEQLKDAHPNQPQESLRSDLRALRCLDCMMNGYILPGEPDDAIRTKAIAERLADLAETCQPDDPNYTTLVRAGEIWRALTVAPISLAE